MEGCLGDSDQHGIAAAFRATIGRASTVVNEPMFIMRRLASAPGNSGFRAVLPRVID
jgi:hypothetical protein